MLDSDYYDVVVIGAGWSGLAAAKTFLQVKPDTKLLIIDEGESIGGTWSEKRLYPDLQVESTRHGLFQCSDFEMDSEDITPQGWIPGVAVFKYLNAYAKRFGLVERTMLNTVVERAQKTEDHEMWRIDIQRSTEDQRKALHCRKLLVAAGLTSSPFLPRVPRANFTGPVYHSKDLGIRSNVEKVLSEKVQNVVVYGGSKSAWDTVNVLSEAGKHVHWIIRPNGGGPSIMTPRKTLGVIPTLDLSNTRFFGMFSPNLFNEESTWERSVHGARRFCLMETVVRTYWRMTQWLVEFSASYNSSNNGKKLRPSLGLDSLFWSPATLGVMTHDNLWEQIHRGENITVHRSFIASLEGHTAFLGDGTELSCDAAVFATGFQAKNTIFNDDQLVHLGLPTCDIPVAERISCEKQKQFSDTRFEIEHSMPMLSTRLRGPISNWEDGYYLYRSIVPAHSLYADRSIAFIGFLRNTGLQITLEAQVLWATAYLLGELDIPDEDERLQEATRTSIWCRTRYMCGNQIPFAILDWLPYTDRLYRDLNISPSRKSNWIAEIFGIYASSDYRGVVEEWKLHRGKASASLKTNWCTFAVVGTAVLSSILVAVAYYYRGGPGVTAPLIRVNWSAVQNWLVSTLQIPSSSHLRSAVEPAWISLRASVDKWTSNAMRLLATRQTIDQ